MVEVDCLVVRNGSMSMTVRPLDKPNCFGDRYKAHDLMAGEKIVDTSWASSDEPTFHDQDERALAADRQARWFWWMMGVTISCYCILAMIKFVSRSRMSLHSAEE